MNGNAEFAYAQARLQARHGLRPSESIWHRLEASKTLGHYLAVARDTALKPWVQHLSADADCHGIERSLRRDWAGYVVQVAAWQPAPWRPAVLWTVALMELPAVAHLLRELPAFGWMRQDPVLREFALDDPAARRIALLDSDLAPIVRAWHRDQALLNGWVEHWRKLWPRCGAKTRASLERLVTRYARHLARMAKGDQTQGIDETRGIQERRDLTARLTYMFRGHSQQPAAAFCHLGLVALDLERLRAGLVRRSLFGEPAEGA